MAASQTDPSNYFLAHKNEPKSGCQGKFDKETGCFKVVSIDKYSWASKVGIIAGDIVVNVDGIDFSNNIDRVDRIRLMQRTECVFKIKTGDDRKMPTETWVGPNSDGGSSVFFFATKTEGKTGCQGKFENTRGEFRVYSVEPGGWADTHGIKPDDTIIAVDNVILAFIKDKKEKIKLMQKEKCTFKVRAADGDLSTHKVSEIADEEVR